MSEKTHKPTPRRLREARKQGEVVRSREVSSLAAFVALWVCLRIGTDFFHKHLANIIQQAVLAAEPATSARPWQSQLWNILADALWIIGPLLAASAGFAVLGGVLQTRGVISMKPITPQFDRINPARGLRNLFTLRQVFELGKMLVKTTLLLGMLWQFITGMLDTLVRQAYAPAADVLHMGAALVWRLMGCAALIYAFAAALDYAHQFYEFIKKQKMSIEELRREHRDTEGDPRIKSRRRAIARETIFNDAMSRLTSASVLVVNPTHVAVALQYEPGKTLLPRVIAKGVDALALRIRAQAERFGVPVLEDPPLARRLFRDVAVDQYIKEEFIDAVAAVFRWVRLAEERRRGIVQIDVAAEKPDSTHRAKQLGEVGTVDPVKTDVHVNDVDQLGGAADVFPNLLH
jgi:type III secretion protein U